MAQVYSKTQTDTLLAGKADLDGIDRRTLNADLALDPSSWDKKVVRALVLTQDATGSRKVTLAGKQVAVDTTAKSETVLAAVWTGTKWMVRSSAASAVSVTPAPEWSAGTTATTGSPTDTSVVVSFSQDIPAGTLQVRYGSTDSWRTVTRSGRNVTLDGLKASTKYAAPQFQVINSAGASDTLTAQPFTTQARPKQWTSTMLATFTAPDGTKLVDYTPEMGGPFEAVMDGRANTTIVNGQTQVSFAGVDYNYQKVAWRMANGDFRARLNVTYGGLKGGEFLVIGFDADRTAGLCGTAQLSLTRSSVTGPDQGAWKESTSNTGGIAESGTVTLTAEGDSYDNLTLTATQDGKTLRQWVGSWALDYGIPLYLSRAIFGIGGAAMRSGDPDSPMHVTEVGVDSWR